MAEAEASVPAPDTDAEELPKTSLSVSLDIPSDENTPEQNDLIARLRATLPECIAKRATQQEGSPPVIHHHLCISS